MATCERAALLPEGVPCLGVCCVPVTSEWINPKVLADYPSGPYAVYVYVPKIGREFCTRNQSPDSAIKMAEAELARGNRPHISLDTCG